MGRISRSRIKRKIMVICLMAVGGLSLLMFQNFNRPPIEKFRPRFYLAQAQLLQRSEGSADIREFAPVRPREMDEDEALLNAHHSGDDLGAMGGEWIRKKAHQITGGADERLVRQLNRGLNRLMSFGSQDEVETSSGKMDAPRSALTPEPGSEKHENTEDGLYLILPKSMKFTSINRLEMDFGSQTHLTCSFEGSTVRWDIVRPISEKFDMNLRHESTDSKSSLHLNYNW